jgi:hypothetical protein
MREICASGSVGGEGGNALAYPAGDKPPSTSIEHHGRICEGFRTPAVTNVSRRAAAGVRKPPRDETAGRGTYWAVPRAQLWGFGRGRATAEVSGKGRLSSEDGDAGRGTRYCDLRPMCW